MFDFYDFIFPQIFFSFLKEKLLSKKINPSLLKKMGIYHLKDIYKLEYFRDFEVFYGILELSFEKIVKLRTIVLTNIKLLIFDRMPNNNLKLMEQFYFDEIAFAFKKKKKLNTSNTILMFRKKRETNNYMLFLADSELDKFYEVLMNKLQSNNITLKIFSLIEFKEEALKILSEEKFTLKSIFFIYYLEDLLEKKYNYNLLDLLLNMYRKVK